MKYLLILDKTHHILMNSTLDPFSQGFQIPNLTVEPSLINILKQNYPTALTLASNIHHKSLPRSTVCDIILLIQETTPALHGYKWIPINQFIGDTQHERNKSEFIIVQKKIIWEIYSSQILNGYNPNHPRIDVWHFCNDQKTADSLVELVRTGVKRATASLFEGYQVDNDPIPEVGGISIVTNFDGIPQLIIKTTDVQIIPFDEVSEEFAQLEGEGDKSLDYWKHVHWIFFSEEAELTNISFNGDSLVICEQFEIVIRLNSL